MARKSRRRSRRRRTRKRRGGTNLFGKDQDHETPRMRIQRMKRNAAKRNAYLKAVEERNAMPLKDRRSAFAKGSAGKASRNVLNLTKGGKRKSRRRRRTRRRRRR